MLASSPPRLHVAPSLHKTYGDLAADLAGDYGLEPDDWQRLILDDWLAESNGRWASLRCGLSVPRQNGKNGALEVRELFGMVGRCEKILHTAHQVKTARKHFLRLKHFFGTKEDDPDARFPELNALVADVRNVNGQEAILLKNGASLEIVARSKGSSRGFTVDVIVFDEAQDMSEEDLEALLSTSSAAPSGNPQWIFTGTPPGPTVSGEVFTRIRTDALEGKALRHCWHEWSCPPDVDIDSPVAVRQANPALGVRVLWDVVHGERGALSDEGFARERLGMWSTSDSIRVIDSESWKSAADPASMAIDRLALGIDVAPDRSSASVALAGTRADGLFHVELDEQRSGTAWIVGWVADRCERNTIRAVVVDSISPAASLLEDFAQAKVKVTLVNGRDMANACGQFYDGVMDARFKHTDQTQVNVALSVASKRPLGDAWAWNRKTATSDITPIVAETLALWGAQTADVKRPTRRNDRGRTSGRRAVVI